VRSTVCCEQRLACVTTASGPSGTASAIPAQSLCCRFGHYAAGSLGAIAATAHPQLDHCGLARCSMKQQSQPFTLMPARDAALTATFVTVFGQQRTTAARRCSQPQFGLYPSGVAVSSTGERYLSDTHHHHVLVYPSDSSTPRRVIGQVIFSGCSQCRANRVAGLSNGCLADGSDRSRTSQRAARRPRASMGRTTTGQCGRAAYQHHCLDVPRRRWAAAAS